MKLNRILLPFLMLLTTSVRAQPKDWIFVNIPTATEEAEYIWSTIMDTKFFQEHNYQVSLPQGPLIEELKQKAIAGTLPDSDYERLLEFVKNEVHNPADYKQGYLKIKEQLELINRMINQLRETDYSWGFKQYNLYTVKLTLYGPGGSYDPDEGSILLYTTTNGQFKSYDNPANTIIHEMVHIGIEAPIINKYNVPHAMKERIVDTFVSLHFGDLLPDYRIKDMGDHRTDEYLKEKEDLKELDAIIERVLKSE